MASLTDLPTACRFAVLGDSDDEYDKKASVGDKAGSKANAAKAKKKRKKKKTTAKSSQIGSGSTAKHCEETEDHEQRVREHDGWSQWIEKDEQYVLSQFQRDLKEALEASKQEQYQKRQQEKTASVSASEVIQDNMREKKKKEKPVVMSLDEFIKTATTDEVSVSADTGNNHFVSALDNFLDWQDNSGVLDANRGHEYFTSEAVTCDDLTQVKPHNEEKPPTAGKVKIGKLISRKKNTGRFESEARANQEQLVEPVLEKKILPATHEDQIQAEMVQLKEELDKRSHELIDLQNTKVEHMQIIEDLKKELSQVKRRNKQLCFILSQAEMKEKSELLMQIEELNEVKEQVVQLHAELEQERSKNSALKIEINKSSGGRQRHGSSS